MKFCFTIILFLMLSVLAVSTEAQVSSSQDSLKVDGQAFKFEEPVTFEGVSLGRDIYGYGSARIRVLRISQRANLHSLEFHLLPLKAEGRERFEKLLDKPKGYYRITGSILNARLGGPDRICMFRVETITPIEDVPIKPDEFVGRNLTFEGLAQPGELPAVNFLKSGVAVQLIDAKGWKPSLAGKSISVSGAVVKTDDKHFGIKNPTWKLVDLKDQVGTVVEISGFLQSLNGHWWFDYGEDRVVLLSAHGPQLKFGSVAHGRRATVKGRIIKQSRPSLKQISLKSDRDLVPTFVVRDAKVQFDEEPKSWMQKFGPLPSTANKSEKGIPILVPERSFRKNIFGNETTIQLFYERNQNSITQILRLPQEKIKPEIAKRLKDADVKYEIKLLYAAILAKINDPVGREYLLKALSQAATKSSESFVESGEVFQVYYALGIFPFLGDPDPNNPVGLAWVETTLIEVLAGKHGKNVVVRSSIPLVMAQLDTPKSKKALFQFALQNTDRSDHFFNPDSITRILCDPQMGLTEAELLELSEVHKNSGIQRRLFQALLRLGSSKAVKIYLASDEDDHYYGDLKSALTPEMKDELEKALPKVKSIRKRNEIRMALCLAEKDPIPGLIALINDPTFTNKNFIFYTLAPLRDPRMVAPTLKMLKTAPDDYWEKSLAPFPLRSALDALGQQGSREAFAALIELLPEKLDRFEDSEFIDRDGWRRIIAGHLIELSGESFETDAKKWKTWLDSHPNHNFSPIVNSDSFPTGTNGAIDFGG